VSGDAGRVPDGTGLSQAEPEEVSALTGFDPSRVTRVDKHDGTTCAHFVVGVFCSFSDPGTFRINAGSQTWYFEWSDRFGALRVGPRGETREQPNWRSPFWTIAALWARQGKRTETIGRRVWALWDQPPVATHYFIRKGRSRVIVRSDVPEGYDDGYSEERFVELPASAIEARRAETTEIGSVHESAAPNGGDAHA
jgi:hypothetical protein